MLHICFYPLDGFTSPPTVVPSAIPSSSLLVAGTWDDVIITWAPSTEVTYGSVLYEINVVASNGMVFSDIVSVSNQLK